MVALIDAALASIRHGDDVDILLAVESGSRAWGFPSPDSDYDCRFIYRRRPDDYMTLFPRRDVIEGPLDHVLDVNGWDLAKTLRLLLKGNAVAIEWLTSPLVYAGSNAFREACLSLASEVVNQEAVARHYLHLGEGELERIAGDDAALKRVFYTLRPAVALRWLADHPAEPVAPMNFRVLLEDADMASNVRAITEDLLERKAATRELGRGRVPQEIIDYIAGSFTLARSRWPNRAPAPTPDAMRTTDRFFRQWVAEPS